MRSSLPVLTAILGLAILPAYFGTPIFAQPSNASDGQRALVGGTIYVSPGDPPILNGVVLIRDGKIAAVGSRASVQVPEGVRTLDCSGLTIAAGFWNSHVHFLERKWANAATIPAAEISRQLQDMLTRYGYTSVFDTWSIWENTRRLRDRIESGEVPGPRIRSTGEALIPKGGTPPELVADILGFTRYQVPEIADAAEASAASRKLLDEGVDGIKLYAQTFYRPLSRFRKVPFRRRSPKPTAEENLPLLIRPAAKVCWLPFKVESTSWCTQLPNPAHGIRLS